MNRTLQIMVLIGCLFLVPLSLVFAQISYEFDFNSDGTFEGNWDLGNVGGTLNVDIWLDDYDCPPSEDLFGAQLYFGYDPTVLQVNGAYPNDSNQGGPFDPTFSIFVQEEPGIYFLTVANIDLVTLTNNKIRLGTIQLERIIAGDTQIVAACDLGGLYTNGYIVDCNLANQYPSGANATIFYY